ncbi:hypothetical protein [Pseudoxanthomonas dokdonensis]|uniref:hypothetical protein n=1 Tax=Pseudoxanthomonas dokdonensis TaxID=344882 RepID=UPI0012ED1EE6|nr:hypothetical protein [Pseudoxanthomonas dokdonensis]
MLCQCVIPPKAGFSTNERWVIQPLLLRPVSTKALPMRHPGESRDPAFAVAINDRPRPHPHIVIPVRAGFSTNECWVLQLLLLQFNDQARPHLNIVIPAKAGFSTNECWVIQLRRCSQQALWPHPTFTRITYKRLSIYTAMTPSTHEH